MFLKKRKFNKNTPFKRLRVAIGILLISVGFLISLIYFYVSFYANRYLYINPISTNKSSSETKIENMLENAKIGFGKVTTNFDDSIMVTLKNGADVTFSPKKNLAQQIASLQLILSRLTIEGKKLKALNFRYDKPVASF